MIKSIQFANAAAIVFVVLSFICWLITLVAPDFAFGIANSWFHMINLNVVRLERTAAFPEALGGFVSIGVAAWVTSYALIELYNRLEKK